MGDALSSWENYHDVLQQMAAFGIELQDRKDAGFPKKIGSKVTCGKGGKDWYKLYEFERDNRVYLAGAFGTYKHGGSWQKVEMQWAPLSETERERQRAERAAQRAAAQAKQQEEAALAALGAWELWRRASRQGHSPYLARKGLQGEACRFLPDGTLVLPLIRYDLPREQALQAVQRILPDGRKFFTAGFSKPRCALRLGDVVPHPRLIMVCEGYATGLSIRLGTDHQFPVFVAWDAGNLAHVVPMVRELYPLVRLLVCADDDWKTFDHLTGRLNNPGKNQARAVAREVPGCDLVWPVFNAATRGEKDTDFDDLRQREGLHVVRRQLMGLIKDMGRIYDR